MKAEGFTVISVIFGIIFEPVYGFLANCGVAANVAPLVVAKGAAFGGLLGDIIGVSILDWCCPWQKL